MNDKQKSKRNFRQSKEWKEFRKRMKERCGGLDVITGHKLRKGFQVHHQNLSKNEYHNLREDWFLCCNNLTHKVVHWLYTYYKKDEAIIDRLRYEMELMKKINKGAQDERNQNNSNQV